MRSSIFHSLARSSGLAVLVALGATSCASERSAQAPVEVHPAPVPAEETPSSPKQGAHPDLPDRSTLTPEQIAKLETALGELEAIPVPIRP